VTAKRDIVQDALDRRSTIASLDSPGITIGSVSHTEYAQGVQKLVQNERQSGISNGFQSDSALMAQFFGAQSEINKPSNSGDERVRTMSHSQSADGPKAPLPNPPLRACELPPARKDLKVPVRRWDKHCPTPPWRKPYFEIQPGDPEPIG
jgi:hypothetical protein